MSTPGPIARGWRRWLRLPSRSSAQVTADVDQELEFHLAMREQELRHLGLDPAAASAEARRRFGDLDAATLELQRTDLRQERRSRVLRWAADLRHDLAYAARRLAREPGFTAAATLTLALGIGATVAMTSVLRRMILAPLPFAGAERLVSMTLKSRDGSIRVSGNPAILEAWRTGIPSLERTESVAATTLPTTRNGRSVMIEAGLVSPGLLGYLRVAPVLGRTFLATEAAPGAEPVAMLSWAAWVRHYGASPTVIGEAITLGDRQHTIVGVMPRLFDLSVFGMMPRSEVWLPHVPGDGQAYTAALGVLRDGATLDALTRDLTAALATLPRESRLGSLLPNASMLLESAGQHNSAMLYLMTVAVALVLLIACINVANLLLARGVAREREMAVRGAIGASRGRLVRQLLVESLMLSILGAAMGLGLARTMLGVIATVRPPTLAALDDIRVDGPMLGVALATALVTALAFGLAPALLTSRSRGSLLQGGLRSVGAGLAGRRARRALVLAEVACSMAILIGAVLLVRSAQALDRMRLGYDVDHLVTLHVKRRAAEDSTAVTTLLAPALERLRSAPGVEGVAVTNNTPGAFGGCLCELLAEGAPVPPEEATSFLIQMDIDSTYLRIAGTRILAGRPPVGDSTLREAAITPGLAARLWPGKSAIGQRFRLTRDAPFLTVVGIAEMQYSPEGWAPTDSSQVFRGWPEPGEEPALTIRVAGDAGAAVSEVTRILEEHAPGLLVFDAGSLRAVVEAARAPQRFTRLLLGGFALSAVLLAALGLYGVMAYGVTQRTREIGVRMALGAQRGAIAGLVAREGLALTLAGLAAGGAGSIALTRLLAGMLNGVSPWDLLAYLAASAIMLGVALLALWLPVRRATRIDPVLAVSAE